MEKKKICSACGTENREDFQFCIHCGARLPAAPAADPQPADPKPETMPPQAPTPIAEAPVPPPEAPVSQTEPPVSAPAAAAPAQQPEPPASAPMAEAPVPPKPPVPPAAAPQPTRPFYAPASTAGNMSELDEMAAFIGPNGYEYAQKMQYMKMQLKKASWNWPVFLFGFLLSLPFVWFYYRRMFKQGTIILVVTLAFMLSISACTAGLLSPIFEAVTQEVYSSSWMDDNSTFVNYQPTADGGTWLDELYDPRYETDDYDYYYYNEWDDEELEALIAAKLPQMMLSLIGIIVLWIGYLIFVVLLAVYANNMYKQHCERKIHMLKATGRCDVMTLRSFGGTSTAAAVLSGILFSVGVGILGFVLVFSSMSPLLTAIATMPY